MRDWNTADPVSAGGPMRRLTTRYRAAAAELRALAQANPEHAFHLKRMARDLDGLAGLVAEPAEPTDMAANEAAVG